MQVIRYIPYSVFIVLAVIFMSSCEDMHDTYRHFIKDGEIIYTGKPDSVMAFSGYNRAQLTWQLVSDPKISKTVIYWNNRADSLVVPVQKSAGIDHMDAIVPDLEEGIYTFEVYTYDNAGNSSVRTEAIGEVFGDTYLHALNNRALKSATYYKSQHHVLLKWFGAGEQAVVVEINYTDVYGASRTVTEVPVLIKTGEPKRFKETTALPDYAPDTEVSYRTGYKPNPTAIDTFYTPYRVVDNMEYPVINLAMNKSVSKSSDCSCGRATSAVDADATTFWQPVSSDRADLNTWLSVDMGDLHFVNEVNLHWMEPQAGIIKQYEILYSDDNSTWHTLHASPTPPLQDEAIAFPEARARYVKLNITLETIDSNAKLAEFEIWYN